MKMLQMAQGDIQLTNAWKPPMLQRYMHLFCLMCADVFWSMSFAGEWNPVALLCNY